MPQHIFDPEKESRWRAYQESVYSDSEFDGLDTLLKIRMTGRMTSKAQVGLRTQSFDKGYDTLPLLNSVSEYPLPHATLGLLPLAGTEGDWHLDGANNLVYRFTGGTWIQIPGDYLISATDPDVSALQTSSGRYINTQSFIIYAPDGSSWGPVGNLLLAPLLLGPSWETIQRPWDGTTRSAIPNGTAVRLGDYVFRYDTSLTNLGGQFDILGDPTAVWVGRDSGSWVYSSNLRDAEFQDENWFQPRQRTLKLPLSTFDEARLVGFWFANPDGSFALSTNADQASPTYRSIDVNTVLPEVTCLRLAGKLGSLWGFGLPIDIPVGSLYTDIISGDLFLGLTVLANLNSGQVHFQATAPLVGLGVDGDVCLNTGNGQVYVKAGGAWGTGSPVTLRPGAASSDSRWHSAHTRGQFQISFQPEWNTTDSKYVDVIVMPSNNDLLATIHRHYVSFWTDTVHAQQKGDLNDQWPGPWLVDASYAISPLDVNIQAPYDFTLLGGPEAFASHYGFISNQTGWRGSTTYNAPQHFDSGRNLHDFYQSITSTYQDILVKGNLLPEYRLATLTSLTFPNQLIQHADGKWYATVAMQADLQWPYNPAAQTWSPTEVLVLPGTNQDQPISDVDVSVSSGEQISRYFDETDPVSLQIQASCTYKTTLALAPGFFPGMTYLEWETAV